MSFKKLFLLVPLTLAFGLIAPITPAVAAQDFTTLPGVRIADMTPGLPYVGDELAAVLEPAADPVADSYAYQWFTVDADDNVVAIPGATGDRYTLTGGEADLWIQVRVTASKSGFNDASAMSLPSDNRVIRLEFTSPPTVSIDDTTPVLGQTLTAHASGEVPAGEGYIYQWQRGNTQIDGAVDSTFTLTGDEVGQQISVTISPVKSGYRSRSAEVTSTLTEEVEGNRFASPLGVTIDDMTPAAGQTLAAIVSGDFPAGTDITYIWCRDGLPIMAGGSTDITPAETKSTLVVTGDDVDSILTVRVKAAKYGYHSLEATSAATSPVQGEHFTSPPVVAIDDLTPTEGQTLTATVSGESPTADNYRLQWYRDGSPILDEWHASHLVTSADVGHTLTFMAKAVKYGYNDSAEVTVTTATVEPAALQTFTTAPNVALSTTAPKVGTVLTATPSGAAPAADSYAYQWYRINDAGAGTAIVGATAATYTAVDADLTQRLRAKVFAVKAGYATKSALSVITARVNKITLDRSSATRGQTIKVAAKRLRVGQTYRIFIDGKTVHLGKASSTGNAIRTVTVPTTIGTGTKKVWVSGYTKAGVRDFTVSTTVVVK